MLRSFTLLMTIVWAGATIAAQSPEPSAPAAPGGAAQQAPATPRPDPGPSSTPAAQRSSDTGKVTYVGCVKPGAGTDSFVLESASIAPAAGASSAPSAVGTSGAGKGTNLNLSAPTGTDLKAHLNHKVEVTGTMAKPSASASASASDAGASATAKPAMSFNVETVKMVAATCS